MEQFFKAKVQKPFDELDLISYVFLKACSLRRNLIRVAYVFAPIISGFREIFGREMVNPWFRSSRSETCPSSCIGMSSVDCQICSDFVSDLGIEELNKRSSLVVSDTAIQLSKSWMLFGTDHQNPVVS
ncbi:hypothetical protein Tco_0409003 [Tanacetum coccineum]